MEQRRERAHRIATLRHKREKFYQVLMLISRVLLWVVVAHIGAYLSRDTVSSCSALQMLGCGCKRLNQSMSCEAFMDQESQVPAVFGFLGEIFRSHPRLTRRVRSIAARG